MKAIKDLGGMFGMGWEGQNPVQFNADEWAATAKAAAVKLTIADIEP